MVESGNNTNMILALHPGTPSTGQHCETCDADCQVDVPALTDDGTELGVIHYCPNHDA